MLSTWMWIDKQERETEDRIKYKSLTRIDIAHRETCFNYKLMSNWGRVRPRFGRIGSR